MMVRGLLKTCVEGVIKRFAAAGLIDVADREYFQHYGYTSRPKDGAEIIFMAEGNVVIAIASDDRRYRLALQDGEVALYDDQGQKIHLKRNKEIEISGCDKLIATCAVSAAVTAPEVTIVASTKVTLTTPLLAVSGNITAGGNITATGNVADASGTKTMGGMRTIFNTHTHTHPANGVQIPIPGTGM